MIFSPAKAWEEIRIESKDKVYMEFVYPLIGFCALSLFIGSLPGFGWHTYQALAACSVLGVAQFGGFFLSAYLFNLMQVKMFKKTSDVELSRQFVGYAFVCLFLVQIVVGLLPIFRLVGWLLQCYTFYIVWSGASFAGIERKDRVLFTCLTSVNILLCPSVISFVFNKLTVIFQ